MYVNPSILTAQDKFIRPLLCDLLYDEVIEHLDSGYPDEATENLMPYIKRSLAWFAYSELLPSQSIKVTESGVVRKADDYSTPADSSLVTSNVKQAFGNGQQFGYRLVQYIKANLTNYPLYEECNCRDNATEQNWGIY
jgi:hypothetical protein